MNPTTQLNSVRKCICIGLFLGLALLVNASIEVRQVCAQTDDAFQTEMAKGSDLLRRRRYEDALKSFKRANDLRDALRAHEII